VYDNFHTQVSFIAVKKTQIDTATKRSEREAERGLKLIDVVLLYCPAQNEGSYQCDPWNPSRRGLPEHRESNKPSPYFYCCITL